MGDKRRRITNLAILSLATAINRTAPPLTVLAGGLVGLVLAPSPVWATLPVAFVVVGMGVTSYPAAAIMRRIGRRWGFVLATLLSLIASLGAAGAIIYETFSGFCLAMVAIGANQAFVHQYRFAAAENVPPSGVSHAVSLMLLSSLVSAWSGPELGLSGRDWIDGAPFAGAFVGMAGLSLLAAFLLLFYREEELEETHETGEEERSIREIVLQPKYILACAAAGFSYAVMSLIMTAAPISMHAHQGHSLNVTTFAIQSHIMAMYLPSLLTGTLIRRFGVYRIMMLGVGIMGMCIAVAAWRQEPVHYLSALVLLGIGWNCLFTAGSTLITETYRPSERFKAQGVNDGIVFGVMAIVSLAAGVLLEYAGWALLAISTAPLLIAVVMLVAYVHRNPTPDPVNQ